MSEIKVCKGDKHFNIFYIQKDKLFINTEEGEGMEINEEHFFDYLDKYFKENM